MNIDPCLEYAVSWGVWWFAGCLVVVTLLRRIRLKQSWKDILLNLIGFKKLDEPLLFIEVTVVATIGGFFLIIFLLMDHCLAR